MKKLIVLIVGSTMLFASCMSEKKLKSVFAPTTVAAKVTPVENRKNVDAVEGLLTLHPLLVSIPTKSEAYNCFLAADVKTIFITSDQEVSKKIISYLPLEMDPNKLVLLQGSFINPFTYFSPEEFEDLASKFAKLGVQLNEYKIARMFNASTTNWADYQKLVENRKQQGSRFSAEIYTAQTQQQSNTQQQSQTTTPKVFVDPAQVVRKGN